MRGIPEHAPKKFPDLKFWIIDDDDERVQNLEARLHKGGVLEEHPARNASLEGALKRLGLIIAGKVEAPNVIFLDDYMPHSPLDGRRPQYGQFARAFLTAFRYSKQLHPEKLGGIQIVMFSNAVDNPIIREEFLRNTPPVIEAFDPDGPEYKSKNNKFIQRLKEALRKVGSIS